MRRVGHRLRTVRTIRVFCGWRTILQLEGQHALGHADQHDVRPLQALGGVQRGEGDDVLVLFALAQGGQQRDGLCHFEQGLVLTRGQAGAARVRRGAAALRHPVAKL